MNEKNKSLVGERFGSLTVLSQSESTKGGKRKWICKCDCGRVKQKPVTTNDLKSGKVKSCGCLYLVSNKSRNKTHGQAHSRLYNAWCSMKHRCYYSGDAAFKNYGGRGITVCEEWRNSFETFYEWAMSHGYSDSLTLDRIDSNGNYCPENCRWVDMKTQQNNRRNNRTILYCGKKYTLSQLAKKLSIGTQTLRYRINNGWQPEELSIKPQYNNKQKRKVRV